MKLPPEPGASGSQLQVRSASSGWLAAMALAAMLSTAGSAFGWLLLYWLAKPLAMLFAIVLVAGRAYPMRLATRFDRYLLAALAASMAGDVFLMLPGNYFIPGLASFLVAHLFFIAMLHQDAPWFASRAGLLAPLGFGVAMYATLWGGLGDPVLKGAVAAYVLVIGLMAAQAIGRAVTLRQRGATLVALGACIFMLSDTLIAINRFLQPVPLSGLWILASYYAAQLLIVVNARPAAATR